MRYEEFGEYQEHLFDGETGELTEFFRAEIETLKEQVALEMGHKPVDCQLGSLGRKLKSCPLSEKLIRHEIAVHWRLVTFCIRRSSGLCSQQKGLSRFMGCENTSIR